MSKAKVKDYEQFQLRLPPGMRERIKGKAERAGISMNEVIVQCLEEKTQEESKDGLFYVKLSDLIEVESLRHSALVGPFKSDAEFNEWCHRYLPRSNKDRA